MKLEIHKAKPKVRQRKVCFKVTAEQVQNIEMLEEWLGSQDDISGELLWSTHLAEKISAEIESRSRLKSNNFADLSFTLPLSLVDEMKQSDHVLIDKGYLPDWDGRVRQFIEILTKNYTQQLELIIDQEPPSELSGYRKRRRKQQSKSLRTDQNIISGVINEPR